MLERLEKSEKDIVREKEQQLDAQQRRQYPAPFQQMDRMFDEFFRRPFFSSLLSQRGSELGEPYLPVDIYEDNESVTLKAEIPGVKRENLNVQLSPDSITISWQKSSEEKVERKDFFRLERSYGSFSRRIQLPAEIQTDQARASFRDGVLEVRIPKSAAAAQRVRKLTVE